jgi:hypothetical protein
MGFGVEGSTVSIFAGRTARFQARKLCHWVAGCYNGHWRLHVISADGTRFVRTAQEVYAMLENDSLWQAALRCHAVLARARIPHAILGGVAVCLHGYQRNTVDVDLLIRRADSSVVRESLERESFRWDENQKEFASPSGIAIQILIAGEPAGKDAEVRLPDPADEGSVTDIEGLPVLRLSRLIESKIACGRGSVRRMHKDFADVVELIVHRRLNSAFARYLHKSLRGVYRELVRQSRGES